VFIWILAVNDVQRANPGWGAELVKNPDVVARASLGVRGAAHYVNSREFGEPVTAGYAQHAAASGVRRRP
jgi:hypothetical protein